jgi:hypothetical protein
MVIDGGARQGVIDTGVCHYGIENVPYDASANARSWARMDAQSTLGSMGWRMGRV